MPKNEILRTISYAVRKHGLQKRSGTNLPYIAHPIEVAQILEDHGHTYERIVQAALLHDVLEDTDATYHEVKSLFGPWVASTVNEVTDPEGVKGKEKREILFKRIPEMTSEARLIKMADNISNVRATNRTAPAAWNRSLKLNYVETCERVTKECVKWWTKQGLSEPHIFFTSMKEIEDAKYRLQRENYYNEHGECPYCHYSTETPGHYNDAHDGALLCTRESRTSFTTQVMAIIYDTFGYPADAGDGEDKAHTILDAFEHLLVSAEVLAKAQPAEHAGIEAALSALRKEISDG